MRAKSAGHADAMSEPADAPFSFGSRDIAAILALRPFCFHGGKMALSVAGISLQSTAFADHDDIEGHEIARPTVSAQLT